MKRGILIVGSLNMDLVGVTPRIPVPGETITGLAYFELPGGKGANQALAAARLGGQAAMLGRVGGDAFGGRLRASLQSAGCAVEAVKTLDDCNTGLALIQVAESGENSILLVPGANARLLPEAVEEAAPLFDEAGAVLLQLEVPLPTVVAAARRARVAGAMVVLDPAPARELPQELLDLVDVLTPNETEAALLAGRTPGELRAGEAEELAGHLQAGRQMTVILKMGAAGCLLAAAGEAARMIPAPRVNAVDTTAAGDVFNAAFAVARNEGRTLGGACRWAHFAAALSVTRLGAQSSVPSREEVEAFIAECDSGWSEGER